MPLSIKISTYTQYVIDMDKKTAEDLLELLTIAKMNTTSTSYTAPLEKLRAELDLKLDVLPF